MQADVGAEADAGGGFEDFAVGLQEVDAGGDAFADFAAECARVIAEELRVPGPPLGRIFDERRADAADDSWSPRSSRDAAWR